MVLIVNTFRNLLKWKSTLIYLVIVSIVPTILSFVLRYEIYKDTNTLTNQLNTTVGIYYIVVFMWVLGIPFLLNIAAKGIGLIANEISDGTLGLLVSMKIARTKIIFYKWLALFLSMLIIGVISILLNYTIITILSNMSDNIKVILAESIPGLVKYMVFLCFIISSLSILISLIVKSRVNAIIIITVFIILIFLIMPLFKNFLMGYYDKYYLYYLDFNYHFSLIYYNFISGASNLTPDSQGILSIFMGIFNMEQAVDLDMMMITGKKFLLTVPVYDYLSLKIIFFVWILVGVLSLGVAMRILVKRDIS